MRRIYLFIFIFLSLITVSSCSQSKKVEIDPIALMDTVNVDQNLLFGFNLDEYEVYYDTVQKGWTWNDLFAAFEVNQYTINTTAERLKDSLIGLKYILAGKPFMTFKAKSDTNKVPAHLVYEPDAFSYISFDFKNDSVGIRKEFRPIEINERKVSGIIEQNSNLSVEDRKSTRLNSSHVRISYAVFC